MPIPAVTRILVADDHPIVRSGLKKVLDDGRGIGDGVEGAGIRGMRERALLVGAELVVGPLPGGGTEVRLLIPKATPPP